MRVPAPVGMAVAGPMVVITGLAGTIGMVVAVGTHVAAVRAVRGDGGVLVVATPVI
jgi:hypothetical protein